jgi:hypothetical protein
VGWGGGDDKKITKENRGRKERQANNYGYKIMHSCSKAGEDLENVTGTEVASQSKSRKIHCFCIKG